ncbi:hypothetical protein [Aquisediminimonas profunda]|uniref:hypothetical protein n=1 Tax=Aquisediminimonas profunda TaxID=1550733 RepID=UPI001C631B64|nr:hypothetical protein [Aquisediminimonas profunda]
MNSKFLAVFALSGAALAISGCTPNDTTMGGALKHNVAVQTIDPDPDYDGDKIEGGDGTHAAAATARYLKGSVKEPVTLTTTAGSGAGSGGSSGSSSGTGSGPR